MAHLSSQQFHERIGSLLGKFKPNNELCRGIALSHPSKEMDLIILAEQEPDTIILVEGATRNYSLRINDRTVDIWQNLKTNGLRGPQECIISFLEHGQHESYGLEEGVMRKTHGFSLPLFRYNITKPPETSVLKPNAPWLDKYEHIYVWKKAQYPTA